jgi:catechol-2,3-dioxygenase
MRAMRIHHLAFRTSDLGRLEGFYAGILGLEVTMRQGDHAVWLDCGGTILMLERADPAEPPITPRTMELIAFGLPPGEMHKMRLRLEAEGIAIEGETDFTIYFRDPDGRRVGISHYPVER